MENAKKQLKTYSIVVLILAAFSVVRSILQVILTDYDKLYLDALVKDPATTKAIVTAGAIITVVVSLILVLPQVFVGYRGMKVAKNPDSKKGFIVWAWILLVLAGIGVISGIVSLVNSSDILGTITSIADALLDAVIFFCVIHYAKIVQKGA